MHVIWQLKADGLLYIVSNSLEKIQKKKLEKLGGTLTDRRFSTEL